MDGRGRQENRGSTKQAREPLGTDFKAPSGQVRKITIRVLAISCVSNLDILCSKHEESRHACVLTCASCYWRLPADQGHTLCFSGQKMRLGIGGWLCCMQKPTESSPPSVMMTGSFFRAPMTSLTEISGSGLLMRTVSFIALFVHTQLHEGDRDCEPIRCNTRICHKGLSQLFTLSLICNKPCMYV